MKQHVLKSACMLVLLLVCSFSARAQKADAITGQWWNAEKTSKIEVYEKGGKYHGKIVHMEVPNEENGNPRTDKENPNDKLKKRPLKNLVILSDLEHVGGNEYEEGEIYDPKSGKTYSCNAKLVSEDQLDLRGYVGFSLIGRTSTWTRAE